MSREIGRRISQVLNFFRYDVREADDWSRFVRKLEIGICIFYFFFMTRAVICYFLGQSTQMYASVVTASMSFLIVTVCILFPRRERLIRIFAGLDLIVVYTFFIALGCARGMGVYGVVLIPVFYLLVFGLNDLLWVGGYFLVFLYLAMWTKWGGILPYFYHFFIRDSVIPIYAGVFLLAIILGVREKRMRIKLQSCQKNAALESDCEN